MSAILLPFCQGEIDWPGFEKHLLRTAAAGLLPAVNMDTGYLTLISDEVRRKVLRRTHALLGGGGYVAGAWVNDRPGDGFNRPAYQSAISQICAAGGTPVLFQSFGLTELRDDRVVEAYSQFAEDCDEFIAFELGEMFAPFGRVYSLPTYEKIMGIRRCIGAKHSSLSRDMEWQRLALRDSVRPDFLVLTGNDRAIDMVMYGSDYLLGLSTFAPDCFALRDKLWAENDPAFHELNDLLQFLGNFAFRAPVPAYKSSAAQFLWLQGWISTCEVAPGAPQRPESDMEVLRTILRELMKWRNR